MAAAGDLIAQTVISHKEKVDIKECARYFLVGAVYIAPVCRTWYMALDKIVGTRVPYFGLKKMAIDQICFAPPFMASVVSLLRLSNGENLDQVWNSLKRDYLRLLIGNYKLWPMVQTINFYYVPINYQVIVVNATSLVWNTYIAYVTEQKEENIIDATE